MGLFDQIGAYLDARKRVAARNLGDLAADPRGMFGMWGNQVREDLTNNMQQMGAGVTDRGLLGQSISAAMGPAGLLGTIGRPPVPKYAGVHRPMADDSGAARLHDLTPAFGEDIYGPNALQYFGANDKREESILRIMKSLRGKPDAYVTIYRGVPEGRDIAINPGDWVTLSPRVAADYGPNVIFKKVKASDVTSWADSLMEFGYFPGDK